MGIVTKETFDIAVKKLQARAEPWINLLLEADPFIFYKAAIAVLLCIILSLMLRNGSKKTKTRKAPQKGNYVSAAGGHKNFNGDTWYPDGWIWDEKKQKWKAPDYQTPPSKRPDNTVSPSGWRWNEIEAVWEPPDIVIKESNERWRWDNVRGIWIDLNKEDK